MFSFKCILFVITKYLKQFIKTRLYIIATFNKSKQLEGQTLTRAIGFPCNLLKISCLCAACNESELEVQ